MRVAVVTPYCTEPDDILLQCLNSVAAQSHPVRHILVADGPANPLLRAWDVDHIGLPRMHGDNGNLGRCVGALHAKAEGYDAVAFLDADNWYRPQHIALMVGLQRSTGAQVCTAARSLYRLDGSLMREVDAESDGSGFADTSCMFIHASGYETLPLWAQMPVEMSPVCDRVVWMAILLRGLRRAHSPKQSVAFRTRYAHAYRSMGETPPAEAKEDSTFLPAFGYWARMTPAARVQLIFGAVPGRPDEVARLDEMILNSAIIERPSEGIPQETALAAQQ
ncbi:MAG: glycosyltransferase family A protein [Reyranellaceae bacterium]